ncbi:DUF4007 family protein [Kamptonema cortianum]|nr:DUF4007 family protein [Kamptonema cortianum]MDL5048057.1 DUF4007 family protein [Oscillatoria amoena NRMC-F 0135]
MNDSSKLPNHRFSGHETFACRYAWLPKVIHALSQEDKRDILTVAREDDAMVELGLGKNMVRSARFWSEATGIIQPIEGRHQITEFGYDLLLGSVNDEGYDPYLEDIQTLWLIHWKLATNQSSLIFAWDFLLNHFHEPELYASSVVRAFEKAVPQYSEKAISRGSLEQLYEVFIHSYIPTRGRKGEVREDNLDCPLVELELLRGTGSFAAKDGRSEPKYAFRREDKPEISAALFAFCLQEFWSSRYSQEQSLPFHSVVVGAGSPGQVFKIPEMDIRKRLLGIEEDTQGYFAFEESAAIPRLVKRENVMPPSLGLVYDYSGASYAR